MRILLKFPIRERAEKFLNTLKDYADKCSDVNNIQVIVSYDFDDAAITEAVKQAAALYFPDITFYRGEPRGKIAAVNRDMEKAKEWDILVLASDDMICQVHGWDKVIINRMPPDLDRVLFFNDGYLGRKLNTMPIMGRTYYQRFNYIYHPQYQSLWCDNEQMEVADMLGKQDYYDLCLFKHEHFSTNYNVKVDKLMNHNQRFFYSDKAIYEQRKQKNFFIDAVLTK